MVGLDADRGTPGLNSIEHIGQFWQEFGALETADIAALKGAGAGWGVFIDQSIEAFTGGKPQQKLLSLIRVGQFDLAQVKGVGWNIPGEIWRRRAKNAQFAFQLPPRVSGFAGCQASWR